MVLGFDCIGFHGHRQVNHSYIPSLMFNLIYSLRVLKAESLAIAVYIAVKWTTDQDTAQMEVVWGV